MQEQGEIIRILGELQGMTGQILEQARKTNGRVTDHETRLRSLEGDNNQEKGRNGVFLTIWVFASAILSALVTTRLK